MMSRKWIAAFAGLSLLVSCGGKEKMNEEKSPDIVGEWELVSVSTKSVTYGSETVEVYVDFQSDNSFSLYQMLGTGRFRKFTGKWKLNDSTLSGTYSDGSAFASTYEVTVTGNTLTLESSKSETDTYRKTSIPASVISNLY